MTTHVIWNTDIELWVVYLHVKMFASLQSMFVIRDNWKVQLVCLSHACLFAKGLSGNSFGLFSQLTFNQVFTFLKLLTDSLFNGLRAVSC